MALLDWPVGDKPLSSTVWVCTPRNNYSWLVLDQWYGCTAAVQWLIGSWRRSLKTQTLRLKRTVPPRSPFFFLPVVLFIHLFLFFVFFSVAKLWLKWSQRFLPSLKCNGMNQRCSTMSTWPEVQKQIPCCKQLGMSEEVFSVRDEMCVSSWTRSSCGDSLSTWIMFSQLG